MTDIATSSEIILSYTMPNIFLFSLIALFTILSAFFSSTEIAFFSLPTSRVRSWKTSSNEKKRIIATLLKHSRQLLVLIFMLNTIVNVLLQNATSDLFESTDLGLIGKIGLPLLLILIFGELAPKWLGMVNNERLALFAAKFYPALSRMFAPFQAAITSAAELFSRLFFFFLKPEPPLTTEELESIVHDAVQDGVLKEHEALLISNWIDLDKKTALDVMTPRSEIPCISLLQLEKPVHIIKAKLREQFKDISAAFSSSISLFKHGIVLGETTDMPQGYLLFSDIFAYINTRKGSKDAAKHLIETAKKQLFFVPETMRMRRLIQELEDKKPAIACVVDEHDMVLGYIRMEDVMDRLSQTEASQAEMVTSSGVQITNPSSMIAPGTLSLDAINAFFGTHLVSMYRSTTIGGWLIEHLDEIPTAGTKYAYEGIIFRVLAADSTKIKKLFIHKKKIGASKEKSKKDVQISSKS